MDVGCIERLAPSFGGTLLLNQAVWRERIQILNYGANPNVVYTGLREAWNMLDDSDLSKNFRITERMKLQLRLKTFNTFNHPLFSGGTYNGINQYAGQIGAMTGGGASNKPRYT